MTLVSSAQTVIIPRNAFLQALIDNLMSRLNCSVASNRGASQDTDSEALKDLLDCFDIVESDKWPSSITNPWPEGEVRLKTLCLRYGIDFNTARKDFRDYVDDPHTDTPSVRMIKSIISVLPVSSADCERGFSTMNLILTDIRNRMLIHNVSSLLFVSLVGPPVCRFKPENYVSNWLLSHRSCDDARARPAKHTYNSRYECLWEHL